MSSKWNYSLSLLRHANLLLFIAGMVVTAWSEVELRTPRDEQWRGTTDKELVRLYNAVSTQPVKSIWGFTGVERSQVLQILAEAERQRSTGIIQRLYALVLLQGAGACLWLAVLARFLLLRPASRGDQDAPSGVLTSAEEVPRRRIAAPEAAPAPT